MKSPLQDRPGRGARAAHLLGALVLSTSAFAADWHLDPSETPLHPTVLTADYEGKSYPVIAAASEAAEIEVSGKLRKLGASGQFQPHMGAAYAAGFITFKSNSASTRTRTLEYHFQNGATVPGGILDIDADYTCSLVSSVAQGGCYLAVIFFKTDPAGEPDLKTVAIGFSEIGNLPAGALVQVKIRRGYIPVSGGNYYCLPMVFTRGREIRSDQCELIARFFRSQYVASHAKILDRYQKQYPSADKPPVAYLRYPPVLPDGVEARTLPKINATFRVLETGEIDSLQLDEGLDPRVAQAIRRALNGWLFLPRLKAGVPVETLMRLPLAFGS